jgi:ABC-type multidrug transport system fused ATPase/permease subunit
LKQNKIIIFDEATDKVDKKTAEQIQKVIHDVLKDCTVIIISHRMTTIQRCEKIMVLEQGSIVEFDTQHVLLNRQKGFLSELVRIANEGKMY